LRHFRSGEKLRFGNVVVETIATPHDAEDGVVFVVDDGKHRLGILTDLGHVFTGLGDVIASLDAVLLESNYDPECTDRWPPGHTRPPIVQHVHQRLLPTGGSPGLPPGRRAIFRPWPTR